VQITFASYNIRKAVGLDGRRDPERIIAVLREIDADIVALQEADRRFGRRIAALPRALIESLTDYQIAPLSMTAEGMAWHGNALLVRRGMVIKDVRPIRLPMLEPRGALCAHIGVEGVTIRVVGMHLCLSGLHRRGQLRAVQADLAAEHLTGAGPWPTVLMGDCNEWSHRGGALRALGPDWQVPSLGRSYPARVPLAPLDRIIASPQWRYLEGGVHHSAKARIASDHLPVFARMEWL